MESFPKLGIVAGGGDAPRQVIESCRKEGRPFFVFCLKGQADEGLADDMPHKWVHLGQGDVFRKTVASEGIEQVVLIGRVRRPSVWELKPDWFTFKALGKIGLQALGDDGLLRAIGRVMEEECHVKIVGAHEVAKGFLMPLGALTDLFPDDVAKADIARGVEVARALGSLDVGQAVVVQQGIVLGLEGIEGTDALIGRCGTLRREGLGGVLVKLSKPQQDARYDLPSIGPDTVRAAQKAGLRGIAAEAGRSLIVKYDETCAEARKAGLFVLGISSDGGDGR